MPLFKRRNSKQKKNEAAIKEDETTVLSEVNSMLNELVSTVSEQTDSIIKSNRSTNSISTDGISKQTNSSQEKDECLFSTNSVSKQSDVSLEIDKNSGSVSINDISVQKDSIQENNTCGSVVQANNDSLQTDSTQKNCQSTDAAQTNDVSKQNNSTQEINSCGIEVHTNNDSIQTESAQEICQTNDILREKITAQENDTHENVLEINSKQTDSDTKNYQSTNASQANDVSKQNNSTQDMHETIVQPDNNFKQTESSQKICEDTVAAQMNDFLKQNNSSQNNDGCKNSGTVSNAEFWNRVSEAVDSIPKNKECTISAQINDIIENNSRQKTDEFENIVQPDNDFKQTESSQKICDDTVAAQMNDFLKQNNSSQNNDGCANSGTVSNAEFWNRVSEAVDSIPKNNECTSSAQTNDITENNSRHKTDEFENIITTNGISEQLDLIQTADEGTNTQSTNNVSKEIDSVQENNECTKSVQLKNVQNEVKQETNNLNVVKDDIEAGDHPESISSEDKQIAMKKTRSSSESGSNIESQIKYVRRKFGSEAEIMSICKKVQLPKHKKGINEAVAKYIDNLIKESISKAIESIDVDSLCEELIKDVPNRRDSKGSESEEDFAVEQRLSSKSISELVEFQNGENKTNENQQDSLFSECEHKVAETDSFVNETDDTDHGSFGGYLADLEDTASVDDLKSIEENSSCNISCNDLENKLESFNNNSKEIQSVVELESTEKTVESKINENIIVNEESIVQEISQHEESPCKKELSVASECVDENEKHLSSKEKNDHSSEIEPEEDQKQAHLSNEKPCENDKTLLLKKNLDETEVKDFVLGNIDEIDSKAFSKENSEISLDEETLLMKDDCKTENTTQVKVKGDSFPHQNTAEEERMKVNWKVGNLQVKLPHKSRGKTSLKAWKKRRVVIQPDEFVNDPTNQSLVISVYGSKKHETYFWHSISSQKAVIFRSSSHTHRYAFTISEEGQAIIHLSADNESETQEWMAAIRVVLWPPSPFMELEKMLSGQEFEVSIIDNEFSYHAGLLGMYGYLSITPKKLILLHPQQGYVIQEWYLNTVDKFQFVLQPKAEDMHKVLCMSTCKDSSTGQGDIIFFCKEAVTLLQSLATTIHQVLSYHSKQEGGKYQKELEELAEWMIAPPQDCLNVDNDEHYKVPPRQVKSLLDIPNFIFNKPLSPVASAIYPAPNTEVIETINATKNKLINTSQDSGISNCTSGDDFLNCSIASFVVGGGPMTGKSSDSELSDAYTPPRTPEVVKKKVVSNVVKEVAAKVEN